MIKHYPLLFLWLLFSFWTAHNELLYVDTEKNQLTSIKWVHIKKNLTNYDKLLRKLLCDFPNNQFQTLNKPLAWKYNEYLTTVSILTTEKIAMIIQTG